MHDSSIQTNIKKYDETIKIIENKSSEMEKSVDELKTKVEIFFDSKKSELEQIILNYSSQLATQSPHQYWKNKLHYHRKLAKVFVVFASIMVVLAIFIAITMAPAVLKQISLKSEDLVLWPIGLFGFCAFLFFWVERILVRLMLSHLHLADDANERIVMVETYFAILTQNAEKTGEAGMDLGIMLQTLFRPAATGIIKDEGVPAQFWDLANRAIGSGGAKPGGPG